MNYIFYLFLRPYRPKIQYFDSHKTFVILVNMGVEIQGSYFISPFQVQPDFRYDIGSGCIEFNK